jgi:stage II sporulation protein D
MKITRTSITVVILTVIAFICMCNPGCDKRNLTEPTPGMNTARQYWMRVLLFDNIRECTIQGQSEFAASSDGLQSEIPLTKDSRLQVGVTGNFIAIAGNPVCDDIIISPAEGKLLSVNGNLFRGVIRLVVGDDGKSFDVINALPVEAYLAGVVGAEMPSYWESHALKAQAVACRTYSLYYKQKYGANRNWDVTKTQSTQVYRGVEAETSTIRQAIAETTGKVLVCEYSDGANRLFPTYYSSVCGGHTDSSSEVLGRDTFGPLTGVPCKYCRSVARKKVFNWAPVEISKDQVTSRLVKRYPNLAELNGIRKIEIKSKGNLGRITGVRFIGIDGKNNHVRGEDFRIALDPSGTIIKSAVFKIAATDNGFRFYDGRGYGHGVGLCQCGSEGMARKGISFEKILSHYYPGSKIHKLEYMDSNEEF